MKVQKCAEVKNALSLEDIQKTEGVYRFRQKGSGTSFEIAYPSQRIIVFKTTSTADVSMLHMLTASEVKAAPVQHWTGYEFEKSDERVCFEICK